MRDVRKILTAAATVAVALLLPHVSAQSSDPCADAALQIELSMARRRTYALEAKTAVECMKSFAWDARIQLNMTRMVRQYMDYYSAGTYFQHNVCPELDLPTVNINGTFDRIERDILAGNLTTYDANRQLFDLFGSVKDGHVRFSPMCVAGAFIFEHRYPLIQVAATPDSIPETYVAIFGNTVLATPTLGPKVAKINGVDPVEYLTDLARNHPESAWIDPDARFNELLVYWTAEGWDPGLFAQRSSWDEDPITIEFANGTSVQVDWKARYSNRESISTSDGSLPFYDSATFYSRVCTRTRDEIIETLRNLGKRSLDLPEPNPDARPVRRDLDAVEMRRALLPRQSSQTISTPGRELMYYELDDQTAVLILSGFTELTEGVTPNQFADQFSRTAARAIETAKKNGMKRLMIDTTYNGGGYLALGHNLVRQLFPNNDKVFFGSNMRWHPALDRLFTEGDQDYIAQSYFSLSRLHTPEGGDWKDFRDMLGPVHRDDDYFTKISIQDENGTAEETGDHIFQAFSSDQPFAIDDVILISSGQCGSTCAVFAEALQILGVKTVTVGGRPRVGPMQGVGGLKGSQVLEFDVMAMQLSAIAQPIVQVDPAFGYEVPWPLSLRTRSRINFRNSWRRDDGQYLPIEFLYTPAEYRMFYTYDMLRKKESLHEAARDIAWNGAKEMSGGPYTPVMGFDGSKFKWPKGSGSPGGKGGQGGQGGQGGSAGAAGTWESLGQLIMLKMGKEA